MSGNVLLLLAAAASAFGQRLPEDFNPERAEREGRKLTAELLSMAPAGDYTNRGTLMIKARGVDPVEFPIRFTVRIFGNVWTSRYEALGTGTNAALGTLVIVNEPNQPSRYFRAGTNAQGRLVPLTTDEVATLKFAGSDFWACDLGLDFLHWPVQRLLKKEMRSSQSCNVLESVCTNAPPGSYVRVVSWLDIDTGGIVYAEAFDTNRKRVKEFAPKAFKKVDGEYQLEEMRIQDLKAKSKTTIVFDLGK